MRYESPSEERFNLELPILIYGFDIREIPFMEFTKTLNINSRGAYFFIQKEVRKKDRLNAIIHLPRKIRNQLEIKGQVVRVENLPDNPDQSKGIALQFDSSISV